MGMFVDFFVPPGIYVIRTAKNNLLLLHLLRLRALNQDLTYLKASDEAPASISTNCLDPWPVSGTQHLCGTQLLSNYIEVVNFCSY